MADLDRLIREVNPEPGQPRVPVPQYQKVGSVGYEKVMGQNGGTYSVLLGPDGQPISSANRLPVEVAGDVAANIQLIKDAQGRLYGHDGSSWVPVKVSATGELILASNVTVNAEGLVVDLGQCAQGPAGLEAWPVTDIDVQAELALVKAELAAIKANQLSGDQKVTLNGSMVQRQKIHDDFDFVPSGTYKGVKFTVPPRVKAMSVVMRANGLFEKVTVSHLLGDAAFGLGTIELEPLKDENTLPSAVLWSKKTDLLTDGIELRIYASPEGDLTPNTASDSGYSIYWWEA